MPFLRRANPLRAARLVAVGLLLALWVLAPAPPPPASASAVPDTAGQAVAFGGAGSFGSVAGLALNGPVVAMASSPDGKGYWLAATDGGVFAFGGAPFSGSMGGRPLNAPMAAMAPAGGGGYWLAGADGGVFAFGGAPFSGSMGGRPLNAPVVGIARDPATGGYWLAAADGGVFAFGGASFSGSMGGRPLNAPVVGIDAAPGGRGYWLVAADGGVFTFGDAPFYGSMGGTPLNGRVVAMAATASDHGYWLAAADGGLFTYGDAPFLGSLGGQVLVNPMVAMAATPDGAGYWLLPTAPAEAPTSLLGRVWNRIPVAGPAVALTFDAGANADGLASILATLRAARVPASFFLTGRFVDAFPAAAAAIAGAGHRLGDHSVDHPHLPALTDDQVRTEVLAAAGTIRAVTGADPAPLFRFPYGDTDARTLALVNRVGYVAVGWTVDTLGWEGTSGGQSVQSVVARVVGAAGPGEIVLMHTGSNPDDGTTLDADALPAVISGLRAAGYRFVTLDALVR